MDLHAHKRTLGIVHIIYGSILAIAYLFIGIILSSFAPFIIEMIQEEEGLEGAALFEMVAGIVKVVFGFIFLFSALPSVIGGIGLLQKKNWGLIITLIAGCISIFSFPFGTAVGVYTLYVYIEDNKNKKSDQKEG